MQAVLQGFILAEKDIKGLLKRRDRGVTRSRVSGTSKAESRGHAEPNKGAPNRVRRKPKAEPGHTLRIVKRHPNRSQGATQTRVRKPKG